MNNKLYFSSKQQFKTRYIGKN